MKIFDNPGNSGKSLPIPAISGTFSTIPTIPAPTADIESARIVKALPKMPGLSKIFLFWICMVGWGLFKLCTFCFLVLVKIGEITYVKAHDELLFPWQKNGRCGGLAFNFYLVPLPQRRDQQVLLAKVKNADRQDWYTYIKFLSLLKFVLK